MCNCVVRQVRALTTPPRGEVDARSASGGGRTVITSHNDPSPDRLRRSDPPLSGEGKEDARHLSDGLPNSLTALTIFCAASARFCPTFFPPPERGRSTRAARRVGVERSLRLTMTPPRTAFGGPTFPFQGRVLAVSIRPSASVQRGRISWQARSLTTVLITSSTPSRFPMRSEFQKRRTVTPRSANH